MHATRRWFAAVLLLATSCAHQPSPESGGASVPRLSQHGDLTDPRMPHNYVVCFGTAALVAIASA